MSYYLNAHHYQNSQNFPKLPPLNISHYSWDRDTGVLSFYLKSFYKNFKHYGDFQSVGFLRQCIPKSYIKDLDECYTLKSALKSLSKWSSNSKIHTETLEQKLKGLKKSQTFAGDKFIMKEQLTLFQKCLEVDSCFFPINSPNWDTCLKI